jgi:hypothetical protein
MSTAEPILGLHPGDVVTLTITAVFKQLHPGTGRARLVTLERAPQWVEVPYLDNAGQPLAGLNAVKIGVAAQLAITPLPAEVIELSDVTLVSINTDEYGNVSTTVRDNATGRVITIPGGKWQPVALTEDRRAPRELEPEPAPELTRTPEEIVARIAAIREGMFGFGFGAEVLLQALTFEQARPVLKPDATGAEWGDVLDSREKVQDAAVDYLEFAIGKALNHRGLSASRSIEKLTEYLWLLGLDDVLERFEAAGYAQYGMPKLRVMAEQFGMWPYPQLQYSDSTAAALAARAERMAAGQRCTPECQSGCDK